MKKMKKVLASLLAATMAMSMSLTAWAENTSYTDTSTVTFTKEYLSVGDGAVSPAETFSFENIKFVEAAQTGVDYTEEWAKANLPQISTVTYEKGAAGSG